MVQQEIKYYYKPAKQYGHREVLLKQIGTNWYYRADSFSECLTDQCCREQTIDKSQEISKEEANKICRKWARGYYK